MAPKDMSSDSAVASDTGIEEEARWSRAPSVGRPKSQTPCGIDPDDMAACRDAIRHGSLSFYAASRLLPARYRDPALALYAFCRLADDAVDLHDEKVAAVLRLEERLAAVYAGRPRNAPADRAFAAVVETTEMPQALPEALLEGLAWDAMERRYATMADLHAYGARVASAVGVMMAVIMGVRDGRALARACDLGVAMQLTNIARDVGEDARAHRIYLPTEWLQQAGIVETNFFRDPLPSREVRTMVRKLLSEARRLYDRGEAGIPSLPRSCRPGIYAARHIYAGIGGRIARSGYDSVSLRARTSTGQKIGWLAQSAFRAGLSSVVPQPATLYARPLPACQFLVDAAAEHAPERPIWGEGRAGTLIATFASLKAKDNARRGRGIAAE